MRQSLFTYRIIAIISFVILAAVQFFLVWNTYQLLNERYYYSEKAIINEKYGLAVRNDKVFPGGRAITDSMINPQMPYMDSLLKNDPEKLKIYEQELANRIFHELIRRENIGPLLRTIKKNAGITDSLEYSLRIDDLHMVLSDGKYRTLYNKNVSSSIISPDIQSADGIRIGGTLQDLNAQNMVTGVTVSSEVPFNYGITFRLYVDTVKRNMVVIRQMATILVLALASILILVVLFFFTFRNWLRQKKLAEMKSDFINNITHEFHTPLSAIIVANKNLRNERIVNSRENVHELANVISRQSDRLQRLFNQVLDITLMEKRNLDKKEYIVSELIYGIITDYRLKLGEQNVAITYSNKVGDSKVELDEFYFTTLLMNILDNAIKYNDKDRKEIKISTFNAAEGINLWVEDNGQGISSKNLQNIFDKFFRGKTDNTSPTRGLGLGLYYVKQCVDAHGWSIRVDSEPEKGSTFMIQIKHTK